MKVTISGLLVLWIGTSAAALPMQWTANETGSITAPKIVRNSQGQAPATPRFGTAIIDPTTPEAPRTNRSFQQIMDDTLDQEETFDLRGVFQSLDINDEPAERRKRERRSHKPRGWFLN
jgi:hypothetical protein